MKHILRVLFIFSLYACVLAETPSDIFRQLIDKDANLKAVVVACSIDPIKRISGAQVLRLVENSGWSVRTITASRVTANSMVFEIVQTKPGEPEKIERSKIELSSADFDELESSLSKCCVFEMPLETKTLGSESHVVIDGGTVFVEWQKGRDYKWFYRHGVLFAKNSPEWTVIELFNKVVTTDKGDTGIKVSNIKGDLVTSISDPIVEKRLTNVLRQKEPEEVKFLGKWIIKMNGESFIADGKYVKIDDVSYKLKESINDILGLKE
jgi:hypothetical protein